MSEKIKESFVLKTRKEEISPKKEENRKKPFLFVGFKEYIWTVFLVKKKKQIVNQSQEILIRKKNKEISGS